MATRFVWYFHAEKRDRKNLSNVCVQKKKHYQKLIFDEKETMRKLHP